MYGCFSYYDCLDRINFTREAIDERTRAGEHCAHVLAELLTSLEMTELQLDELWTFVKKRKILAVPKTLSASTGGRGSGRPKTPAMAANVTDHRWTFSELLAHPTICQ
jgi:hypothetical protein